MSSPKSRQIMMAFKDDDSPRGIKSINDEASIVGWKPSKTVGTGKFGSCGAKTGMSLRDDLHANMAGLNSSCTVGPRA